MDESYIINDTRDHTKFKELTFSGFKKLRSLIDVLKV